MMVVHASPVKRVRRSSDHITNDQSTRQHSGYEPPPCFVFARSSHGASDKGMLAGTFIDIDRASQMEGIVPGLKYSDESRLFFRPEARPRRPCSYRRISPTGD
jgi:hypothetical protein